MGNSDRCAMRTESAARPPIATELWVSDGRAGGTRMIKDIREGPLSSLLSGTSYLSRPLAVDGVLYFVADDGVSGSEVWRTDGTAAGT